MNEQVIKSEYLLLFRGTHWDAGLSPEEIQKIMSRWSEWFEGLTAQNKLQGANPLMNEGKIVSGKGGRTVADGPFAESKEAIGGYFLIQVSDMNEALEIARGCPGLDYGITVEVRPVAERCPGGQRAEEQLEQLAHAGLSR